MAGRSHEIMPLPKFYFTVNLGSQNSTISFQEVSGLETETQPIECRHDDNKLFSTIKMPEILGVGNIALKKIFFFKRHQFLEMVRCNKNEFH